MVIDSPIVYNPQNRVKRTGDTMTGVLKVNPADGTADPLFEVETTGTNQYGWDVGTLDLTGVGYGKYPSLIARSNGVLGDGVGVVEGSLVVGNGVTGYFGHGFIFLDDATLTYLSIISDWNWDGVGGNRIKCNDDFFVDDILTAKFLTVGDGIVPNPYITFKDSVSSNPTISFVEADLSFKPSLKTNMITKGLWFDTHITGDYPVYGGKISLYGERFESDTGYLIGVESNAIYMQSQSAFTWYIATQPLLVSGGQIGYSMRLNAAGLEIGSGVAGVDYIFKMFGETTSGTITWLESEGGLFDIVGVVNFNNGAFASGSDISVEATQLLVLNYGTDTTYLTDSGTSFAFYNAHDAFIFNGVASSDVLVQFSDSGTTSTGEIIWRIINEVFEFSNNILAKTYVYLRDTSSYIYDDGTDLLIESDGDVKITTDCNITGELLGCRQQVTGGNQGAVSANAYQIMGVGGTRVFTSTFGWVMPRAGSIVSISTCLNITVETTQGDIVIQSRVNDTPALTVTVNSGGVGAAVKKGYAVQARNTAGSTFVAGDLIQIYTKFDTNTFVGTINGIATIVETVYDT